MHFQDRQPVLYELKFSSWTPGIQMARTQFKLITLAQGAPSMKHYLKWILYSRTEARTEMVNELPSCSSWVRHEAVTCICL